MINYVYNGQNANSGTFKVLSAHFKRKTNAVVNLIKK